MSPLASALWLRACDQVGAGVVLDGKPWIGNAGRLLIGARVHLASVPVQSHLVVARGGELSLGDDVVIGHGAAIAAHGCIHIGAGARLGPFVSIQDTDFHVAGERDAEPEVTPVTIGARVRIGSRVTVLRGSVIGEGAVVLAGSVVSGEVPPGVTVGGVPARPAGSASLAAGGTIAERVVALVGAALGKAEAPGVEAVLADLDGWDSLAALRVLLSLEEAFGLTLDEKAVPRARRVSDLIALVEAAHPGAAASPSTL